MTDKNDEPEVEIKIKAKKPDAAPPERPQGESGYDPLDLLKAPAEPPTPKPTPGPTYRQFLGIVVGLILILLGITAWAVVGNALPLLAVAVGVGIIAANTLIRPKS